MNVHVRHLLVKSCGSQDVAILSNQTKVCFEEEENLVDLLVKHDDDDWWFTSS